MGEQLKKDLPRLCCRLEALAEYRRKDVSCSQYVQGSNFGNATAYDQAREWIIEVMENNENG